MDASDTPRKSGQAFHPRPSTAPIVLALVLVAGAVAFGVFGQSIAGRLSMGGGTPLADLVAAAGEMRGRTVVSCLQKPDEPSLHPEEARGLVQRTLRRSPPVPDLTSEGFQLRQVADIPFLHAQAGAVACATYQGQDASTGRWVHLFLLRDEGQFLRFDSLGRPRPLAPGMAIEGSLPGRTPADPAVVVVWSDGPVLHLACFEDESDADRLRDAVGAP